MADIERHRERLDVHGEILAKDVVERVESGAGGTFFLTHGTAVESSFSERVPA